MTIIIYHSFYLSCTTVSDELSRLWRLAVLSPGISVKGYEEVVDQLRTLNARGTINKSELKKVTKKSTSL